MRTRPTSLSGQHFYTAKMNALPFVFLVHLEVGPSVGQILLKLGVSECRVRFLVPVLCNRGQEDRGFDV